MEFLPLGSIVQMHGTKKLFMIIARGLVVNQEGEQLYVDYAAVTYPEGLIQDRIYYVNRESIAHVIAKGYSDSVDQKMIAALNEKISKMPYKKAELKPLT